ncbi:hypothetical protein HK104_001275 [Borealophlyctis nickersoniae]|nr:hypothetical protein HK104_001275 [Borealophlyctis nickersoniae]
MSDIVSIVSECKRLLTNLGSCTEEEARAAAAACDLWLTNNQNQNLTVQSGSRNPSKAGRVPLEMVQNILRNIYGDGDDEEEDRNLLACRLVNKQWREIAWHLFWYRVQVPTADDAVQKLLHPWAVEALHGTQVRALNIENPKGLGPLLGAPSMVAIRILTIRGRDITRNQLLMVFENLPNLISLEASICSQKRDQHAMRKKEALLWLTRQKKEDEIWHRGFGNLKALAIALWDTSVALDLLGRMAACSVGRYRGDSTRYFPKSGQNAETLKASTRRPATSNAMEHLIGTCVNLKYLELVACPDVAKALPYLAKGPFLYGFTIHEDKKHPNQDAFLSLLTKRGSSLRTLAVLQNGQDDRWLQSVAKAAPNLRQLAMYHYHGVNFTSEGLIAFFHLAKKLRHFHIRSDHPPPWATEVSVVANAMGIYFGEDPPAWPNYAQSMEDDWIGV